jgi:hypothetical protein
MNDVFNSTISKGDNFNPYENKMIQTISKGSKGMFGDLGFSGMKSKNELYKSVIFVREAKKLTTMVNGFHISALDLKDKHLKILLTNEDNFEETQKMEIFGLSANQTKKTFQDNIRNDSSIKLRYETLLDLSEVK